MEITSRENETFRELLKLTDKKWRRRLGLCIVEGEKAVRDNSHRIERIFVRPKSHTPTACGCHPFILKGNVLSEHVYEKNIATSTSNDEFSPFRKRGARVYEGGVCDNYFILSDKLFDEISSLETDQGVLAVVKIPPSRAVTFPFLVLDGIQDSGNMGTLLRTAAAFGFDTVFCLDCVDVWSQKVLRASSGVSFGLNIIEASEFEKPPDCVLFGADSNTPSSLRDATPLLRGDHFGIVLGSEGRGISEKLKNHIDHFIKIPMCAGVESLNVAVAGGILMYELKGEIK